jgi:hypothetical protein
VAGERGVHLAEGKRPTSAEVGVVVALQVVAVARFTIKEPQEGHRNTHTSENTLCVYVRSIDFRASLQAVVSEGFELRCRTYVDLGEEMAIPVAEV